MLPRPKPRKPGPGQESVWDYPRPPRLEATDKRIEIVFNGLTLADTRKAFRVLETSHPPTYYLPPQDVQQAYLHPANGRSICEWKGAATYFTLRVGNKEALRVAWSYPLPTPQFAPLKDYLAFYAQPMDACYVDGEQVIPQPGGFYGGWITSHIVGPFKGEPGSEFW